MKIDLPSSDWSYLLTVLDREIGYCGLDTEAGLRAKRVKERIEDYKRHGSPQGTLSLK